MMQVCACVYMLFCVLFVCTLAQDVWYTKEDCRNVQERKMMKMRGKGTGNTIDGHLPCSDAASAPTGARDTTAQRVNKECRQSATQQHMLSVSMSVYVSVHNWATYWQG